MTVSPGELIDLKLNFKVSLANLKQWYDINGPEINRGKTECIVITSKHNTSKIDSSFQIIFDGHEMKPVTVVKSLGVLIDNNLDFDEHTNRLCSKLNIISLKQTEKNTLLNKQARLLAIDTLVMSRINHCSTIWSNMSKEQLNSMQKGINFATKVPTDGKYTKRDHVTPLMKNLRWLNIQNLLQLKKSHIFTNL